MGRLVSKGSMAFLIAMLWLGSSASAEVPRDRCDSTDIDDGVSILYKDAPIEQVKQIVQPESTFSDDAQVICAQSGNMEYPRKVKAYQIESGAREGFRYRIFYSDSSGSVSLAGGENDGLTSSLWSFDCSVDSMDDSRSCYVNQGSLFVWYRGPGNWSVHIGFRHYPGSEIALRVGEGKAVRGKEPAFGAAESQRIVRQLVDSQSSSARLRYQKWPSGIGEDTIDLQGLGVALDLIKWAYDSLKP